MATPDLDVIKEIPGYKVILKAVLKAQIQQLVEQLADHTDEESVILTASVSDGTLSHLGSESGKVFLDDHDDIKSQFLGFCLKRQHKKQQKEKELEEAAAQRRAAPPPGRYGPGYSPRSHGGTSPRHQFSPTRFQSPRQNVPPGPGPHPVALTRVAPRGGGPVRSSPYPANRPVRRPSLEQGHGASRPAKPMRLPVSSGTEKMIKIEAIDNSRDIDRDKTMTQIDQMAGLSNVSQSESSPSQITPSTPQPSESNDDSSSSTIPNEPSELKLPEGLSLGSDFSNLISETDAVKSSPDSNIPPTMPQSGGSGSAPPTPGGSASNTDPNVNVKVEAVTESEMDLEITGVEPGWVPNVQNMLAYNPSSSGAAGNQGDLPGDESQDYISEMDFTTTQQDSALMEAYAYVKEMNLPIRRVAKMYNVPESTLRSRLRKSGELDDVKRGRPTLFTQAEETQLAEHCTRMASQGYGYSSTQVIQFAEKMAREAGKKQMPKKCWYYGFIKRFPDVITKKLKKGELPTVLNTSNVNLMDYFTEIEHEKQS